MRMFRILNQQLIQECNFYYQRLTKLVVAKFGGSAIGADGLAIPIIIQRINSLKKDSKVIAVFSAPLTIQNGKIRSLTDIVLEIGKNAEKGETPKLEAIKNTYEKIPCINCFTTASTT